MFNRATKHLPTLLLLFFIGKNAIAQNGLCPPNLDFEFGDFTHWVCRTGSVAAVNGVNKVTWLTTGQTPGQHTIIPAATAGTDQYGRFPRSCPNGSNYSVQLGNNSGGHQAESISYTYTIPANATVFSILFNYAVVFQDPNHLPEEQPRFRARIIDLSTNSDIPCVSFDFTASASLPGFRQSAVDPTVFFKDWTPVTINLSTFAGRTIQLEFTTSDCVFTQHFGYAYIDVNTACNGAIQGNTICAGDLTSTLTAPFGFQNYTWYSDPTFSTILSNTQTLTLTPPPTVGTVFPVIVEPFTGFGCRDTLYANIAIANKPVSNAGADVQVCTNEQIQIGASSASPLHTYSWTPASQVSNPTSANPLAWVTNVPSTEFIVKTTDVLTGCFSRDTVLVSGKQADTTLTLTGKNSYCVGDATPGELSVSNSLVSVQWYNGNTPIPGATSFNFQPLTSGNYWAQVKQLGCTDSTRQVAFAINPLPVANAGSDVAICINETRQIGSAPNAANSYNWSPALQVNNPTIANPQAWPVTNTPQEFIVRTTNITTGCFAFDTVVITGKVMDTAMQLIGKTDYCNGDPLKGNLSVNSSHSAWQWYEANTAIIGATGFSFTPPATGNYWVQMQSNGCTDSSRTVAFTVHAVPVPDFRLSTDTGCITSNNFLFTNQSSVVDNAALNYLWQFSDGSTQTNTDANRIFTTPGRYQLRLTATTAFGCSATSADSTVWVMPNVKPSFTWDSVCIGRPAIFTNLTVENNSPLVSYTWRFNNGGPFYNTRLVPPITYTTAGVATVSLATKAIGCENYTDSVLHSVQINKPVSGFNYKPITVPQGTAQFVNVRGGIGNVYNWRPQVHLSNYNSRYTQFFANGDDVLYYIDITDNHTCITTDTLLMQVLKKPGYYLPTAFTPNGDGLNDIAVPHLVGMKGLKSFSVYNRWGNRIFYTNRAEHGWDGRFNGIMQDIAVYVWVLEFYDANNNPVMEKGTISIVK